MDKNFIKDFNDIMNMFEVSIYAQRWLESSGNRSYGAYDSIIVQNEYLLNKLRVLCVNYLGEC